MGVWAGGELARNPAAAAVSHAGKTAAVHALPLLHCTPAASPLAVSGGAVVMHPAAGDQCPSGRSAFSTSLAEMGI